MDTQDQLQHMALISGLLSGYKISSEILDEKFHKKETEDLGNVLQKLMKLPSPEMKKKCNTIKRKTKRSIDKMQ